MLYNAIRAVADLALASLTLDEWLRIKRAVTNDAPYAERISIGLAIRLSSGGIEKRNGDPLRRS